MLLGVAGPGGQFPRPVPVPHIIQGVLGIRFTHIHYTCNMQVFQLFLPVFAVFRAFLHCFSYFWPPGPTCRAELGTGTQSQGAGNHNPPWVGARKTTHRAGSQAAHSTAQGRGTAYRPHPRGGAPPSARGGGPAARGGRQAREGSRQETGQHSGAGGQRTRRAPAEGGRPAREKGRRSAPTGRLPQMPRAAVPHGASGWGLWPPPERGTSRAKRCNAAPRRGGPAPTRPHVAGLHGRSKQRTGPPAPGGRWRDGVGVSR